jgi:hypothetical protein
VGRRMTAAIPRTSSKEGAPHIGLCRRGGTREPAQHTLRPLVQARPQQDDSGRRPESFQQDPRPQHVPHTQIAAQIAPPARRAPPRPGGRPEEGGRAPGGSGASPGRVAKAAARQGGGRRGGRRGAHSGARAGRPAAMALVPSSGGAAAPAPDAIAEVPATPGSRLFFAWGAGTQIRLCELGGASGGGGNPCASTVAWCVCPPAWGCRSRGVRSTRGPF